MKTILGLKKEKIFDLWHLVARNVFLLVNIIIFAVAFLLHRFGSIKEAVFLASIVTLNIILGIVQDIHAWVTLERLQLLTKIKITREDKNGTKSEVYPEDLLIGDRVTLRLGDQVSCDGVILSDISLEVSESLITGESTSLVKKTGDTLYAGSIITSGAGVYQVSHTFEESRISQMTTKIKRYTENLSPIQLAVQKMVKYSGYALLLIIAYILSQSFEDKIPWIQVVNSIGALASTIVPQGLVIATTLIFAYGSIRMYRKHVLLQDVSAAEKMGRIKNLCLDKTGTLTETILTVEEMHAPTGVSQEEAKHLSSIYLCESMDTSETVHAIEKFLGVFPKCEVSEVLSFSSGRQYGGVRVESLPMKGIILAGSPDIFLPHLTLKSEQEWLTLLIETHSLEGKHLMCFVRTENESIPRELSGHNLSLVAVYVLKHELREGIRETLNFFKQRGVDVRIISGDNAETVRSIAKLAGVSHTDKLITGADLEKWSEADYVTQAKNFFIFARIKPEQKEKIISALKKEGFTAMIGDGANDALAIKKADLGIAMFDGVLATRQIASVVLTKNSFAELPEGVKMADSIIKNIEIFSSIFFNQTFVGLFLFLWMSIIERSYPLAPLNVTLINYFTIGLPGLLISYWAMKPSGVIKKENGKSFLRRVLPFPFFAAMIQSLCIVSIYELNRKFISLLEMRTLMVISFILVGYVFFMFAPRVYMGYTSKIQKIEMVILGIVELLIVFFILQSKASLSFFDIGRISVSAIPEILLFIIISSSLHFGFVWSFFPSDTKTYLNGTKNEID